MTSTKIEQLNRDFINFLLTFEKVKREHSGTDIEITIDSIIYNLNTNIIYSKTLLNDISTLAEQLKDKK